MFLRLKHHDCLRSRAHLSPSIVSDIALRWTVFEPLKGKGQTMLCALTEPFRASFEGAIRARLSLLIGPLRAASRGEAGRFWRARGEQTGHRTSSQRGQTGRRMSRSWRAGGEQIGRRTSCLRPLREDKRTPYGHQFRPPVERISDEMEGLKRAFFGLSGGREGWHQGSRQG